MKLILSVVALALVPALAFAGSGQYVCTQASNTQSQEIARALGSLNCDTAKPTNVASYQIDGDPLIDVCCVQK